MHLIFGIIQRFFFGVGGIIRWFFFQLYNECFTEKYPRDLDYYIDNKNNAIDKNGFSIHHKNFFSGIFVFVLIIILLEKFDNK